MNFRESDRDVGPFVRQSPCNCPVFACFFCNQETKPVGKSPPSRVNPLSGINVFVAKSMTDSAPLCPLTGDMMRPYFTVPLDWRRPDDPRAWQIWWNDKAAFGQIFPRPTPSEAAVFYDIDAYYTHAGRTHREDDLEKTKVGVLGDLLLRVAWRADYSAEPTPQWWQSIIPEDANDALEIGSGDGDRMITYAPFVRHVRGVEPDPRAVAVAHARKLDVLDGTAEDLPEAVKDRRYDLIVFSHVLEHTIDPVASLRNAGELLSDRGIMSVEVPNNACFGATSMTDSWRWLDAPRHLNFFTPQSLQACAEAAGLKVQAVLYRGYVRQFLPEWMIDEARVHAIMERRFVTQADVRRQVKHSLRLLAKTFFARPEKKYDSVRILCSRA